MIKRFLQTKWSEWCKKVDKHNEKLDYATREECWEYTTIFSPLFFFIFVIAFGCFLSIITHGEIVVFEKILGLAITSSIFLGLGLYANWKVYEE